VTDKQVAIGIAFVIGFLGFLWFITRRKQPVSGVSQRLELRPVGSRQYSNKEAWDVTYNDDGLPTKIVIHREAMER